MKRWSHVFNCWGGLTLAIVLSLAGCSNQKVTNDMRKHNSIYHWKTTFNMDSTEIEFMHKHNIDRLYLRMFDVATEPDYLNGGTDIVPIATTEFVTTVPNNVEIVPVTYITIEALRAMNGREPEFAELIVKRLLAMSSYNECGTIKEIQLDCDWTSSTKSSFCKLCQLIKDSLHTQHIALSVTVRLHQLQETPPPADRGVLMIYNTGALKDIETRNSILHIDDVKPYIKQCKYPIPLDFAFPIFGWGVKFEGNRFVSIVPYDDCVISDNEHEHIRQERPTFDEILEVKRLVEQNLGKPANGNILYHLDSSQIKHYADNEISQILND